MLRQAIGGYSNKKINTFASVFPTSNPKYVLIVMLDEPKKNSNIFIIIEMVQVLNIKNNYIILQDRYQEVAVKL